MWSPFQPPQELKLSSSWRQTIKTTKLRFPPFSMSNSFITSAKPFLCTTTYKIASCLLELSAGQGSFHLVSESRLDWKSQQSTWCRPSLFLSTTPTSYKYFLTMKMTGGYRERGAVKPALNKYLIKSRQCYGLKTSSTTIARLPAVLTHIPWGQWPMSMGIFCWRNGTYKNTIKRKAPVDPSDWAPHLFVVLPLHPSLCNLNYIGSHLYAEDAEEKLDKRFGHFSFRVLFCPFHDSIWVS